jgi:2-dehydro-3-deoxyphosphogluconate aldolase / (4S)-4-hydroxy-2-oxoglutarate aldolase
MPTGGVSLGNGSWFKIGVGGNLLAPAATGDFEQATEIAKQYIKISHERSGDNHESTNFW